MLHILLWIVKIIGYMLLFLLGLMVFLILAILFYPVSYSVSAQKKEEGWKIKASFYWLFRLIFLVIQTDGNKKKKECYLLGIPIFFLKRRLYRILKIKPGDKRKKKNTGKAAEKRQNRVKKLLQAIQSGKIKKQEIRLKTSLVTRILRHVRPRKIQGNIRFGFEDPAHTGETLALIGAIYPVWPKKLNVTPDFTQAVLEGSVWAKGRGYGVYLLDCIIRGWKSEKI